MKCSMPQLKEGRKEGRKEKGRALSLRKKVKDGRAPRNEGA